MGHTHRTLSAHQIKALRSGLGRTGPEQMARISAASNSGSPPLLAGNSRNLRFAMTGFGAELQFI